MYSQLSSDFTLLNKFDKSDFNYCGIDSINNYIGKNDLLNNVFNTQKGNFTVYRFIRTYTGKSKINDSSISSELILIKEEPQSKKIIEAIYFPLDWKELPLNEVLIKSVPNVKLRKKTRINRLKLDNLENDNGILYFN